MMPWRTSVIETFCHKNPRIQRVINYVNIDLREKSRKGKKVPNHPEVLFKKMKYLFLMGPKEILNHSIKYNKMLFLNLCLKMLTIDFSSVTKMSY